MATINNIKKRANEIKNAYEPESVTAENVGGLFYDIADVAEQAVEANNEAMQEAVRAAQESASAVEQASDYLGQLNEAIENLPDGQAVSAQVAQTVVDLDEFKGDVKDTYGDYDDINEYLNIVTDADGHMLEATKKDGTKVFFGGVDSPEIQQQSRDIAKIQENTEFFDNMLSEEFAEVKMDDAQHVIMGIKRNGTVYIYNLDSPSVNEQIRKQVIELVGNPVKDVVLHPSVFLPDEVRDYVTELEMPDFSSASLTVVNITTQQQFEQVMGIVQGGETTIANTDLLLNLNTDVRVSGNPSFTSGRTIVINANGHKILGWNATYQPSSIKGANAYCAYTGNLYSCNSFVAPDGEVLRLARTKCYIAASRIVASDDIEDVNGNVIFHEDDNFPRTMNAFGDYIVGSTTYHMGTDSVYHCKFQLPPELADITIEEEDNVYVNLTSDWTSVTAKVKKAEDGYLYFDYVETQPNYNGTPAIATNYIGIDNDWHVSKIFTSFYLINYKLEDNHSVLIKTIDNVSTLIFPSRFSEIGESYTTMFNVPSGVNIRIYDAEMFAQRIIQAIGTVSTPSTAKIVMDKCVVHGCTRAAAVVNYGSELYVTRSEFYDCDDTCVYAIYHETKLIATHNYIHDIGGRRVNSYGIFGGAEHYIAHNKVVDYGYGAIRTGVSGQQNPSEQYPEGIYYSCVGIVEYNEVYQTPDYFQNKAQHFVPMDAGAIYNTIFNDMAIIRHNIIYRYTGRGFNRGIYLDGGCNHIYVYGNIIASTPKSWSINAYFAQDHPYYGLPYTLDNVYRYILNNYVENGIKMEGRTNYPVDNGQYYHDQDHETGWNGQDLADNHCYLGHNIINTSMLTTESVVNGIAADHKEEQYEISVPSYQGSFATSLKITEWLNSL